MSVRSAARGSGTEFFTFHTANTIRNRTSTPCRRSSPRPPSCPEQTTRPDFAITGPGTSDLTWTPGHPGHAPITGYDLQWRVGNAGWTSLSHSGTTPRATLTGLVEGTRYRVQVRARNRHGAGPWSQERDVRLTEEPGAPAVPRPVNRRATSIEVETDPPAWTGPSGYDLLKYRWQHQERVQGIYSSPVTADEFVFNDGHRRTITTAPERCYRVRVRAQNITGATETRFGPWSPWAEGICSRPRRAAAPGTPSFSMVTGTSARATWTRPGWDGQPGIGRYDTRVRHRASDDDDWSNWVITDDAVSPGEGQTGSDRRPRPHRPHAGVAVPGAGAGVDRRRQRRRLVGLGHLPHPDPRARPAARPPDLGHHPNRSPGELGGAALHRHSGGPRIRRALPPDSASAVRSTRTSWRSVRRRLDRPPRSGERITGTSYTLASLAADHRYEVRVRAKNQAGEGGATLNGVWSPMVGFQTLTNQPGPPAKPALQHLTPFSVRLTWTAPTHTGNSAITGYDVEHQRTGPGGTAAVADAGNDLMHTLAGLTAETDYRVRVRARNNEGSGAWSDALELTTRTEAPSAPDAPTVDGLTRVSAVVTWTAPDWEGAAAVGDYDVEYRPGMSGSWLDHPHSGTALTTTLTGLTAETDYQVRVRAGNAHGGGRESPYSSLTAFRTLANTPGAPDAPTLHDQVGWTHNSATIRWNAPAHTGATAIDGYDVQWREGQRNTAGLCVPGAGNFADASPAHAGTGTSYAFTGLDPDTCYEAQVRASNGDGDGPWSPSVIFFTLTLAPYPPTNMAASDITSTGATLTWNPPSWPGSTGVVNLYSVGHRAEGAEEITGVSLSDPDSICSSREVAPGSTVTTCSFRLSGLTPDTNYQGAVLALNGSGPGGAFNLGPPAAAEFRTLPNAVPDFAADTAARELPENTAADTDIGDPVTATDGDADATLTYTLGGTDAAAFGIDAATGQISTVAGAVYDFEAFATPASAWSVTVTATDQLGGSDTIAVTIGVTDVVEVVDLEITGLADDTVDEHVAYVSATPAVGTTVTDSEGVEVPASPIGALTWTLEGDDAAAFTIDAATGVVAMVARDFENPADADTDSADTDNVYAVTVKVTDADGNSDSHDFTVTVNDLVEPPAAPAAPTFGDSTSTSLTVNWIVPATAGPPITGYDLQYRLAGTTGDFTFGPQDVTGTSTMISALQSMVDYEVQVRATNEEGDSDWSPSGTGTTVDNAGPVFASAGTTRSVRENPLVGASVGAPVTATDADADATLTYTLGGADAASFAIDQDTGQIRTVAGVVYDFEAFTTPASAYAVTVTATDQHGASNAIAVTIALLDVGETSLPPGAPVPQTVAAGWTLIPEDSGGNDLFTTGQSFRLIFVTSTGRNADPSDITDYNDFVQARAAAGHTAIRGYSSQFRALISTATVHARDNAATTGAGVPIYWLDGARVATGYTRFYGGWESRVGRNELGATHTPGRVWTGTNRSGQRDGTRYAGGPDGRVTYGSPGTSDPVDVDTDRPRGESYPLYALSPVFTVAGTSQPGQVTGVTVTERAGELAVTWNAAWTDPAPAGTGYIVQWKESGGSYSATERRHAVAGGSTTSYTIPNLTPGTTYAVRVIATRLHAVNGPASAEDTGTPTAPAVFTSMATFTVDENTTAVGTVTATDADGDGIAYSLAGTDANLFSITGTGGVLSFDAAPDFESPQGGEDDDSNAYTLTVTATSGTGNGASAVDQELTVTVEDVNEAPEFDVTALTTDAGTGAVLFSVVENTTAVGTVAAADPDAVEVDATVSYGLSGDDAGLFDISGAGVITFKSAPDFEDPKGGAADDSNTYRITIQATAGAGGREATGEQEVTVTVTDANEGPEFDVTALTTNDAGTVLFSVVENTSAVGTVAAADPDAADAVTYVLSGTDAGLFDISGAGAITFKAAPDFEDPEGGASGNSNTHTFTVEATGGTGDRAETVEREVTVTVTDANEGPEFDVTALTTNDAGTVLFSVVENTSAVGTMTAADPDGPKQAPP